MWSASGVGFPLFFGVEKAFTKLSLSLPLALPYTTTNHPPSLISILSQKNGLPHLPMSVKGMPLSTKIKVVSILTTDCQPFKYILWSIQSLSRVWKELRVLIKSSRCACSGINIMAGITGPVFPTCLTADAFTLSRPAQSRAGFEAS